MHKTILINDREFAVSVIFARKRHCSCSIRGNEITIRLPERIGAAEAQRHAQALERWAVEKIEAHPERFNEPREFRDGEVLYIDGRVYIVRRRNASRLRCSVRDATRELLLHAPAGESRRNIYERVLKTIARHRLPLLKQKIRQLNAAHFGASLGGIRFKNNSSNWGSCSRSGNINVSYRLLFAPQPVLEYVCIHELAHLRVFGHNAQFWQLVKSAMPDYEKQKQWLREHGAELA
jgi:predicted metal-dependent hydrolase